MDRLTFLRHLLGGTALLTLPPLDLLPKPEQDLLAWTKDGHRLFLYDCHVRGFRFHQGPQLLGRFREDDPLDLVREYGNAHDENAVAVYWEGQHIGYLPMNENVVLANLIDYGMRLECRIVAVETDEEPWRQCFIAVDLVVPAHPSFNQYIDHYLDRPDAGYKQRRDYLPEEDEQLHLARQHISDNQLVAFLQAVEQWPGKQPPAAIGDVLGQLRQGRTLEQVFGHGCPYELHVRPAGRLKVISLAPRTNGYGGEWRVAFHEGQATIQHHELVYVE
jgi:hypothetical protein